MARKAKSSRKRQGAQATPSQAEQLMALTVILTANKDYEGAVTASTSLLSYLPQRSSRRIDALVALGNAQAMLKHFPEAFEAFSEALDLAPFDADLWFNRGQAGYFTMRFGRAYKDFSRALELNKDAQFTKQIEKSLKRSRKWMEKALRKRGQDFTLDQLIEQEDHYQRGLKLLQAQRWSEAEEAFKASIAMSDCLTQPWGNLGSCLMMQKRFDEAEEAWKHALMIDRWYRLAKRNLKLLPEIRENGLSRYLAMRDPMNKRSIEESITVIEEK